MGRGTLFAVALIGLLLLGCTAKLNANEKAADNGTKGSTSTLENSAGGTVLERTVPKNSSWKYVVFLPPNYNASKSYPVIVGLHGTGGSARDHVDVWKGEAGKNNFILAFPQSPDTQGWDIRAVNQFVAAVVKDVRTNYNITNIYLTGHSAGARMIVTIAMLNPIFRGVAMVDGALPPIYCPTEFELCDLQHSVQYGIFTCATGQNFYMLNGENDQIVTKEEAEDAKRTLEAAGVKVTQRFLPNRGHEYPPEENPGIMNWFKGLEENPAKTESMIQCKLLSNCSTAIGRCTNYKLHSDTSQLDLEIENSNAGATVDIVGVVCTQDSSYGSTLLQEALVNGKGTGYYGGVRNVHSVRLTKGQRAYIAKSDDPSRTWLSIKCTDANGNLPEKRGAGAPYNGTIFMIVHIPTADEKQYASGISGGTIATSFEN